MSPGPPRSPNIPDNWARDNLHLLEFMADGKARQAGRTWLTHQAPIGVGTALVECFTSYVTRLAYRHSVCELDLVDLAVANTPFHLLAWEPKASTREQLARLIAHHSEDFNGTDELAFMARLGTEVLTGISTLDRLNAAPLEAFALPKPILRGPAAWCPACLQDWRDSGRRLYEPLLWKLSVVSFCPVHAQPLVQECPTCHSAGRHLGYLREIGWCETCKSWLGKAAEKPPKKRRLLAAMRREAFASLHAGILLAFMSADSVEWVKGDFQSRMMRRYEFGTSWSERLSPSAVGDRLIRLKLPSPSEPAQQLATAYAEASLSPAELTRRNTRRDGAAQGRT